MYNTFCFIGRYMVNNTLIHYMNKSPQTLSDLSYYIDILIKEHSTKNIIDKAGIDKNVLYRLQNKQNVTVENYLKIRNAFPNAFRPEPQPDVSDLPILGQIINASEIQVLNPAQPTALKVPTELITGWQPVFGYYYSDKSHYDGCVHVFTTKNINSETINQQCHNRLVMIYPKDQSPIYAWCHLVKDTFKFFHTFTKAELFSCPKKNNLRWSKFVAVLPFNLMEFAKPTENDTVPM
jgi:hypothetical protein